MSRVPSLAGFIVKAVVGAVAVSVVGTGQAGADSMSPDSGASPLPVSAVRYTAAAAPGSAAHRHPIRVGSVTIPPCKASRLAWCTRINVPLDYQNPAAGHLKLGFQWYPATSGTAVGTILAVQGGPGFPTTDYAADYRGRSSRCWPGATCSWSTCAAPGTPRPSCARRSSTGRQPTASPPTPSTPASAASS
jgi:hypothetical protein